MPLRAAPARGTRKVCRSTARVVAGRPHPRDRAASRLLPPRPVRASRLDVRDVVEVERDFVRGPADRRPLPPELGRVMGGGELLTARSEEHTSELQSLMRISYAVFCLKKKKRIL